MFSTVKDKRLISILQTNSSKIVDENGEPKVVRHNTNNKFNIFNDAYRGSNTGDMGFVGISYPAEAITGSRADGARNYVIFNENDAEIKDRTMFRLSSSKKSVERYDKENGTDVKGFFDFLRGGKVFEKGKPTVFHIANAGSLLEQYGIKGKFMVGQFTFSKRHTQDVDHNLDVKEWIDVINNLNNPLAIASYKGLPNEYRIYTYATINGKTICVGVNVSLQNGSIKLSNIISAYGRDINNLLGKEGVYLLYPDKEELKRRISQVSTGPSSPLNATSTASVSKDNTSSVDLQVESENSSENDATVKAANDIASAEQLEVNNETRFRTSSEIEAEYPNWLDGTTTDSGKHSTQVEGTRKTYNKVADWIEQNIGKDVAILDASSGMGYGTADLRARGFNIEDVEPYQSDERRQNNPATYDSYDSIDKQYDYIISNAVLNVIPDDWRAGVLHDIATHLKPGGRIFINTRKAGEEKHIKDKIELDSPQEVLVKRNGRIASYQRFFTPAELREWVQQELGEGYTVEIASKANSGTNGLAAVVVTKNNENSIKDNIETLFYKALSGEFKGKPISIGRLTDAGKAYLEQVPGITFKNHVDFVLNPSDLVHIYKDHFGNNEKDKGQNIPLDIKDIRNLVDVISRPNKVVFFKEKDGSNRNMFYFFKEAEAGTYNLMEIYSDRKGNLTAKTFYKTKKDAAQRVMDIEKSLLLTSETYSGAILSDTNIPQIFDNSKLSDIRFRTTSPIDIARLPNNEEVIYRSEEITPEQSSLLERPNFAQYPTEQEFSK